MNAALEDVQREHPGANVEEAFTRGYQRGRGTLSTALRC